MNDHLKVIIHNVDEECFRKAHLYYSFKSNSEEQMYLGCNMEIVQFENKKCIYQ